MAVTPNESVLVFIKHLRRYVPNGRQLGIACNKFTDGIDQFIEFKVAHVGIIKYKRPDI
jgi:hypothetical protein